MREAEKIRLEDAPVRPEPVAQRLQHALDELGQRARGRNAGQFETIEARRLRRGRAQNAWRPYVLGTKVSYGSPLLARISTLPKQGTLAELQTIFDRSFQSPLAEILEEAGQSPAQAANLLLEKLQVALRQAPALKASEGESSLQSLHIRTILRRTGAAADLAKLSLAQQTSERPSAALDWSDIQPASHTAMQQGGVKSSGGRSGLSEMEGLVQQALDLTSVHSETHTAGQSAPGEAQELSQALQESKAEAVLLKRGIESLETLLTAAHQYAVESVTLIQQYLDWIRELRDQAVVRFRRVMTERELQQSLDRVDRDDLARKLAEITIGMGIIHDDQGGRAGVPLVPHFQNPNLNQSFHRMMEILLQTSENKTTISTEKRAGQQTGKKHDR